jgi:anhydro-N-acetylmuramic acid kinase
MSKEIAQNLVLNSLNNWQMKTTYQCIGTMSGTSLDGLDIALCTFSFQNNKWEYTINNARTFPYSDEWKNKLLGAENLSGLDLMFLHNEFGIYTGKKIKEFIGNSDAAIDFIASHGHTVFHQPGKGLTLQIGSGAEISVITNITTICDFRSVDVALKGQGAPLVPIGDKLLFEEYKYCLNLGGFANISFDNENNKRVAFDICPVNILINHFVKERGLDMDKDGVIASKGSIHNELLQELNHVSYYSHTGPKSLGKEWLLNEIVPLFRKFDLTLEDKLRTISEHIAIQIYNIIKQNSGCKILVTGGGVYNRFLMDLIQEKTMHILVIPPKNMVNFKEALIFAFLGLLRYTHSVNCLQSVTGAARDNIGGAIYQSIKY